MTKKKQSDSSFGEAFASLLMLTLKHPEIAKAAFYAIQDIGDGVRAALAPKPRPNTVAELPELQEQEPQPSPSMFALPSLPSPFGWPSNQNSRVVWVNGNFIRIP